MRIEKTQESKKTVRANVRFNKIKACLCVFWGFKAIWCSSGCSDRGNSHSADSIELNKKQTVAHLVPALLWLKSKVQLGWFECHHAVFLKDCHLNQQGLSAEHLNARNQIQGFHVCCLYFKLEWLSSKCKAKQGQAFLFAWTCASVKVGVMS